MRPIPQALRDKLDADKWMHRCCLTGRIGGKIDWHHNLIFAGRQVNEVWTILPLSRELHDRINEVEVKERCDWIMLSRATDEEILKYSKAINLLRRKSQLVEKFGVYKNDFTLYAAQNIPPRTPGA